MYVALAVLLWRERTGHVTLVGRLADTIGRLDGVPRWAALTPYLHAVSLLACAFGVWWDIAVHIDKGRDTGPFGTPAHYPIFFGILGVIISGVLPIALARQAAAGQDHQAHQGLADPVQRGADHGLRHVRAGRVPARRRLAPAVR